MYKNEISIIYSSSKKIACDGSISSSNHPKIYLNISKNEEVICPYCGIKYIYQKVKVNTEKKKIKF